MFSGTAKLAGLDDFLVPSQECVKPISHETEARVKFDDSSAALREMLMGEKPDLVKARGRVSGSRRAEISLTDCLACSGCVTSAETILIESQNCRDFLSLVDRRDPDVLMVVSISIQSKVAFALKYGCTVDEAGQHLAGLFRQLGVWYILDTADSEALCLLQTAQEFVDRWRRRAQPSDATPSDEGPGRGFRQKRHSARQGDLRDSEPPPAFPFLTSHCPGWICFAEKTLTPDYLDCISKVQSSQLIQGKLVKTLLVKKHRELMQQWFRGRHVNPLLRLPASPGTPESEPGTECMKDLDAEGTGDADLPERRTLPRVGWREIWKREVESLRYRTLDADSRRIFHVFIEPCYDKKLEIIRPESRLPHPSSLPAVDLVLATSEIAELLNLYGVSLKEIKKSPVDDLMLRRWFGITKLSVPPSISSGHHARSGSFAEFVFRRVSIEFNGGTDSLPNFRQLTNRDFEEAVLSVPDPLESSRQIDIRFVKAYGFRNIQNVIQNIKNSSKESQRFHFVEIMACPGGCINGGGQRLASSDEAGRMSEPDMHALLHEQITIHPESRMTVTRECIPLLGALSDGGGEGEDASVVISVIQGKYRSLRAEAEKEGLVLRSEMNW